MNYDYKIGYMEHDGEKKDVCFIFDDGPNVFTTFFASDVEQFSSIIKEQIEQVLSKKKKHIECSGNDCYWNIGPVETLIVDNFANEGEPSEITVETQELRRLIDEWIVARDKFREQKAKSEIQVNSTMSCKLRFPAWVPQFMGVFKEVYMNEKYSSPHIILHRGPYFDERSIPDRIQSFSISQTYPDYGAWLHFYEKDEKCKAYTEGLTPHIGHIKKFLGSVTLDRSVGWCDPPDVQQDADNLNRFSRELFKANGIPYIINVRFGDENSYPFCFGGVPQNSILFIGNHGTQRYADYKAVQFAGTCELIKRLHPRVLLVYGGVNKKTLEVCMDRNISLVRYPSQCELAHLHSKRSETFDFACTSTQRVMLKKRWRTVFVKVDPGTRPG